MTSFVEQPNFETSGSPFLNIDIETCSDTISTCSLVNENFKKVEIMAGFESPCELTSVVNYNPISNDFLNDTVNCIESIDCAKNIINDIIENTDIENGDLENTDLENTDLENIHLENIASLIDNLEENKIFNINDNEKIQNNEKMENNEKIQNNEKMETDYYNDSNNDNNSNDIEYDEKTNTAIKVYGINKKKRSRRAISESDKKKRKKFFASMSGIIFIGCIIILAL